MLKNKIELANSLGYKVTLIDNIFKVPNTNTYIHIDDKFNITSIIKQ